MLANIGSEEGGGYSELGDKLVKAGGNTSDGVIKLVHELESVYKRITDILSLPYNQFGPEIKAFNADIAVHPNPLVPEFFMVFDKCRQKEFAVEVTLAMVKAAAQYKLHGEAGLKNVADPCGNGPFAFERFSFQGVDRGFKLKSPFTGRGFDEVLIFVEKDGPPFQVIGKNAGKAPSK